MGKDRSAMPRVNLCHAPSSAIKGLPVWAGEYQPVHGKTRFEVRQALLFATERQDIQNKKQRGMFFQARCGVCVTMTVSHRTHANARILCSNCCSRKCADARYSS